jgi:uncharacterized membrane protein YdjX (TVP38/TMEM64 family)
MLQRLQAAITPSKGSSLARAFSRLGWAGFWMQVVFGSLPIILMVYYLTFSSSGSASRTGLPFVEYLTIANIVLLAFTTFWSYRYTRLAKRLMDPQRRPPDWSGRQHDRHAVLHDCDAG